MKKLYICLLTVLLAVFSAVGVLSLVDRDQTESKVENRRLASKPEFTLTSLLDGSYFSSLETYYSDTFPGRDLLLKANQVLNGFYHFSGSSDNLLVLDYSGGAENGGMSLTTDTESTSLDHESTEKVTTETGTTDVASTAAEPMEPGESPAEDSQPTTKSSESSESSETQQPEEAESEEADNSENLEYTAAGSVIIVGDRAMDVPYATDSIVKSYAEAVSNLHNALGNDIRVISLVTPNAAQFYSPKDMHTGASDQEAMIDLCYSSMGSDVVTVDAFSKMKAHKDEYIYFRTDHHWTQLGAYYAYTAFCEALGWAPIELDEFETGQYTGFLGSMYNWSSQYPQSNALKNNPDTLTYYLPIVETHARYYADADLENSTAYPVSVIYQGLTEDQTNKYLCFLGGDHPAMTITCDVPDGPVCLVLKDSYGNAFIPFLTSHYSKIIVIDPREFNQSGKPSLDLKSFADEQGVDDLLVINYPFMVSSDTYVGHLNHLVGIDLES